VADHGSGIALEDRDNIFERFYRSTESRDIAGKRLGLSMAAAIAELHGFSIYIEDNHPGAVFVLKKQ
jgi:signal transduction histidine kinase